MRWQEIAKELALLSQHKEDLANEWTILKHQCKHKKLPKRDLRESYMDTCPDCGYITYCYALSDF